MDRDIAKQLQERVVAAFHAETPLAVVGGGSKAFLGREPRGEPLRLGEHRGIVSYQPTELVITARAGTPLSDVEAALADNRQMLPFEPPHFGVTATLGGTIACGLSGPRRPYAGAARDYVLGMTIINGCGDILRFGGQVMKNVAGFDVSRLMVGAMGTLGVQLEISLKVLPRPAQEITLVQERTAAEALVVMNHWAGQALPLSATCYDGDRLYVRFSGAQSAVESARRRVGGDVLKTAATFWDLVREHHHGFFAGEAPLWRMAVPPATPPLALPGKQLIEWGGAQRWLSGEADGAELRSQVAEAGGHIRLYRGGDRNKERFHPLPQTLSDLHRRLKHAFDPKAIFNPGRMYAWG
jgi:glycolate dehydrogenase FAD-binding subunit